MPNPGFMYHPAEGKRLFDDLSPAYQAELERDGWLDSPDKISPVPESGNTRYDDPSSRKLGTSDTNDRPARDIRDLGPEDFRAGGEITSSAAALGRLSVFFDPDGDRKHDDIPDDVIAQTVDAMSRDEVVAALTQAGGDVPDGVWTYPLRSALLRQIAPGKDFAGYPGYDRPGDEFAPVKADLRQSADANIDSDTLGARDQNVGNGPGLDSAEREAEILNPPLSSDGTQARTAPVETTDQPGGPDEKLVVPNRIGWLNDDDLTKDRLTSWLDKHGVSYKARDSKDDLIALVRANADQPIAE